MDPGISWCLRGTPVYLGGPLREITGHASLIGLLKSCRLIVPVADGLGAEPIRRLYCERGRPRTSIGPMRSACLLLTVPLVRLLHTTRFSVEADLTHHSGSDITESDQ